MGYLSLTETLVTTRALLRLTQELFPGILYGACVIPSDTNARPTQMWGEIGLMEPPGGNDQIVGVLVGGYFGKLGRLHWTGSYPVTSEVIIYFDVYGPAGAIVRCTWFQLKPPNPSKAHDLIDY